MIATVPSIWAETSGPPRRRFYIWHAPPDPCSLPSSSTNLPYGWGFQVTEVLADGMEEPYWDTWEMTFEEIVRYPEQYGPKEMTWRREDTGEAVDIYSGRYP